MFRDIGFEIATIGYCRELSSHECLSYINSTVLSPDEAMMGWGCDKGRCQEFERQSMFKEKQQSWGKGHYQPSIFLASARSWGGEARDSGAVTVNAGHFNPGTEYTSMPSGAILSLVTP